MPYHRFKVGQTVVAPSEGRDLHIPRLVVVRLRPLVDGEPHEGPMAFEYPTSAGMVRLVRARTRWIVRFAEKGRRSGLPDRPSNLKGYNLNGCFGIYNSYGRISSGSTKLSLAGAVRRAGVDRGVCQCLDDGPSAQVPRPRR